MMKLFADAIHVVRGTKVTVYVQGWRIFPTHFSFSHYLPFHTNLSRLQDETSLDNYPGAITKFIPASRFSNNLQKSFWKLDTLRRIDFGRVERAKETYMDYMGGCLYPESLIQNHTEFLRQNILGNTHSLSNTQVIHTSSYPERLCWFHPLDLNYRWRST